MDLPDGSELSLIEIDPSSTSIHSSIDHTNTRPIASFSTTDRIRLIILIDSSLVLIAACVSLAAMNLCLATILPGVWIVLLVASLLINHLFELWISRPGPIREVDWTTFIIIYHGVLWTFVITILNYLFTKGCPPISAA